MLALLSPLAWLVGSAMAHGRRARCAGTGVDELASVFRTSAFAFGSLAVVAVGLGLAVPRWWLVPAGAGHHDGRGRAADGRAVVAAPRAPPAVGRAAGPRRGSGRGGKFPCPLLRGGTGMLRPGRRSGRRHARRRRGGPPAGGHGPRADGFARPPAHGAARPGRPRGGARCAVVVAAPRRPQQPPRAPPWGPAAARGRRADRAAGMASGGQAHAGRLAGRHRARARVAGAADGDGVGAPRVVGSGAVPPDARRA